MAQADVGTRPGASPALVVAVLSSVGLIASLCMTLVVPIVPQLPALLSTTPANASWVITATLLGGAVATPIAGRLGDMIGKRRVLVATLALLVVGALICALTSSLVPVLVGRSLQGVAVSAVPLGISLMRDALPPERLGSGIALMSATLGIGGGLGLPLSALIVQIADWHALFWTAAVLGAAGILLILAIIPESAQRSGGRFDGVGAVALTVGLVLGLLAVSKGAEWGWGSATTLGSAIGAVVVLLAWGLWELRTRDPIVDLRVTVRRAVLVPNLVSVPVGVAMFTGMVTFPQLLQAPTSSGFGLGLSLLAAGLVLAPNGVVMMLMSPVTARVSARFGPRTSLQAGLVIIVTAYALGTMLLSEPWHIALVIALVGAGVALAYGSLPDLIMRAVPTDKTAAANGLNTLMRSVGTSTASAVAAVVLSAMIVRTPTYTGPSLAGLQTTLWIAAGCGLVALVATTLIPVLPRSRSIDSTVVETEAGVPDGGHGPAVHGHVRLAGGAPASEAHVTLVDLHGRQLAVVPVEPDGTFRAPVDHPETVLVIASGPGGRPIAQHVSPEERSAPRDLVLAR
ncbi:MFS transporter [Actinomycetospora sp. NBRC 106378]|uniref:MFS transporter n=1 Tax=Actinomycetospora sp. NBRC 106378 TaxID=3032208 RepID=UPI00249FF152|nr:MFS transporter [Actinomycetospora sp. NBRC 106378]GLZ55789.1 MFS transporter [Actinomycetospora sp. NBRC 106378]